MIYILNNRKRSGITGLGESFSDSMGREEHNVVGNTPILQTEAAVQGQPGTGQGGDQLGMETGLACLTESETAGPGAH